MFILKTSQGASIPGPGLDSGNQKIQQLEIRKSTLQSQLTSIDAQEAAKQKALAAKKAALVQLRQQTQAKKAQIKGQISSLDGQIRTAKADRERKLNEELKKNLEKNKEINRARNFKGDEDYDPTKRSSRSNMKGFARTLQDRANREYARGNYEEAERLEQVAEKYMKKGEQAEQTGYNQSLEQAENSGGVKQSTRTVSDLSSKRSQASAKLDQLNETSNAQMAELSREIESLGGSLDQLAELEASFQGGLEETSTEFEQVRAQVNSKLGDVMSRLDSATDTRQAQLEEKAKGYKGDYKQGVYERDMRRFLLEDMSDDDIAKRSQEKADKEVEEMQEKWALKFFDGTMDERKEKLEEFMSPGNIRKAKVLGLFSDDAKKAADDATFLNDKTEEVRSGLTEYYTEQDQKTRKSAKEQKKEYEKEMKESKKKVDRIYGGMDKIEDSYSGVQKAYAAYQEAMKTPGTSDDAQALRDLTQKINGHKALLTQITPENPGRYSPSFAEGKKERNDYLAYNDTNTNRWSEGMDDYGAFYDGPQPKDRINISLTGPKEEQVAELNEFLGVKPEVQTRAETKPKGPTPEERAEMEEFIKNYQVSDS